MGKSTTRSRNCRPWPRNGTSASRNEMRNKQSNEAKLGLRIFPRPCHGRRMCSAKMYQDLCQAGLPQRKHLRSQSPILVPALHRTYDPHPRSDHPSHPGPQHPRRGTAAHRWSSIRKAPATLRLKKKSVGEPPTYATIVDNPGTPAGTALQHRQPGEPPLSRSTWNWPQRREKTTLKSDPGALFWRTNPVPYKTYHVARSQEQYACDRPYLTRV